MAGETLILKNREDLPVKVDLAGLMVIDLRGDRGDVGVQKVVDRILGGEIFGWIRNLDGTGLGKVLLGDLFSFRPIGCVFVSRGNSASLIDQGHPSLMGFFEFRVGIVGVGKLFRGRGKELPIV